MNVKVMMHTDNGKFSSFAKENFICENFGSQFALVVSDNDEKLLFGSMAFW